MKTRGSYYKNMVKLFDNFSLKDSILFKTNFIFKSSVYLIFILLISFVLIQASVEYDNFFLISGKNRVVFNITGDLYVKDLAKMNPSISVISYTNNFDNTTHGYINAFNGLGDNFKIESGTHYEIILKNNSLLIVPPNMGYIVLEV